MQLNHKFYYSERIEARKTSTITNLLKSVGPMRNAFSNKTTQSWRIAMESDIWPKHFSGYFW
jgi:hypothetical protein